MTLNDTQRLIGAYIRDCLDERHPLKVYDDGFGPLWVYGETYGPMGVIRARTFDDAYGIALDEFMTRVGPDEVLEAYGLYLIDHDGLTYVCPDFDTDAGWIEDFGGRIPARRVLAKREVRPYAARFAVRYIEEHELELIEGYEYQTNGTGTGIVSWDLNGQELVELTGEVCERYDITVQVTENE